MSWPTAARDHDTFCVSCHTVLPYALARPGLRRALGEQEPSANERKILDNVTKRVRLWKEVGPYYLDEGYGTGKPAESRGTEAVLNALILAAHDSENGKLTDITRTALEYMWAEQETHGPDKGAWRWLQFGMEPWEARDSKYYGAALAAIAAGMAPEDYRSSPEIQDRMNLLRDYLEQKFETQSVLNHVVLLWAASKWPGLVSPERQQSILHEALEKQGSDGGWELSSLSWPTGWSVHSMVRSHLRSDWTRQAKSSDGYATGLITYVLRGAGVPADDPSLKRGLAWLTSHQNADEGSWPSLSLVQRRNPASTTGHFMRDAATAYAVLALTQSPKNPNGGSVAQGEAGQNGFTPFNSKGASKTR
ncbi:MAG TPA: hypothetical protein VFO39_01125 [Candidatus Sulfotelmatobacter sp.]|nr:hypothetical protein [Candidatus Sulfotelmatobacter sp.]